MFKIYRTKRFETELQRQFSTEEVRQIEKFEKNQLKLNPYVGKPLKYPFFREKKVASKRVYYLIYENMTAVLLVGASRKKEQQETINSILRMLEHYNVLIQEMITQHA